MNIKALITTFAIIGSSSVAMARPAASFTASAEATWSFGYNTTSRPVVIRDHRPAPPVQQPVRYDGYDTVQERMMFPDNNALAEDASVYKGPLPLVNSRAYRAGYQNARYAQWTAITAPTRIDRGRQFITDLPDIGAFSTVRLQNVTGSTSIGAVLVRFKDGTEQIVQVNQRLSRNNPVIDIRLKGGVREIHGFVINGSSAYGSAYQVLAL